MRGVRVARIGNGVRVRWCCCLRVRQRDRRGSAPRAVRRRASAGRCPAAQVWHPKVRHRCSAVGKADQIVKLRVPGERSVVTATVALNPVVRQVAASKADHRAGWVVKLAHSLIR